MLAFMAGLLVQGCGSAPSTAAKEEPEDQLAISKLIGEEQADAGTMSGGEITNPKACEAEKTGDILFFNQSSYTSYDVVIDGEPLVSLRPGGIYIRTVSAGIYEVHLFISNENVLVYNETLKVPVCGKLSVASSMESPPTRKLEYELVHD
jgi:hypothetical protein